jgi:rubrerythrin
MNAKQVTELLLQSLEHERGGIQVYETALRCAVNEKLREEWKDYLEQTREHERLLRQTCTVFGLDPEAETPGRAVVRHVGKALVEAMELALSSGPPEAAELVACECVVLAETKDHQDWKLLGKCAERLAGVEGEALRSAHAKVEDQEDQHLYHSMGWCRELWVQSLGLPAVLPPPEETRKVTTAIGAARAEQAAELSRVTTPEPE